MPKRLAGLAALACLVSPSLSQAQDSPPEQLLNPPPAPVRGRPAPANDWRVRLFNGDDLQYVECNGRRLSPQAGFTQSVEVSLGPCINPRGRTDFTVVLFNNGGGYTWGFSVVRNGQPAMTTTGKFAESYCGIASKIGCDHKTSGVGVLRRWRYYLLP